MNKLGKTIILLTIVFISLTTLQAQRVANYMDSAYIKLIIDKESELLLLSNLKDTTIYTESKGTTYYKKYCNITILNNIKLVNYYPKTFTFMTLGSDSVLYGDEVMHYKIANFKELNNHIAVIEKSKISDKQFSFKETQEVDLFHYTVSKGIIQNNTEYEISTITPIKIK